MIGIVKILPERDKETDLAVAYMYAIEKERERCAKIADSFARDSEGLIISSSAVDIAALIRAGKPL